MIALTFQRPIDDPRTYICNPYANYYSLGYHTGIDILFQYGSIAHFPIAAVAWGRVTYAKRVTVSGYTIWGNLIVIRHELLNGSAVYSRSAHVENMRVKVGDIVHPGQHICDVGDAFGQTSYHLHFDISKTAILETVPWDWPGEDLDGVYRRYWDPAWFIQEHLVMPNDYTALKAAVGNLKEATSEVVTAVDALDTEPPPPPTYTVKFVKSVNGVNVRSTCSTANSNNIVGGLSFRAEVHVNPAVGCTDWDKLEEPVSGIAAGNVIYNVNLSTTRPL